MTGTARHREMATLVPESGSYYYFLQSPQWQNRTVSGGQWTECDDTVGNPTDPNAFSLKRSITSVSTLTGRQTNVSGTVLLREYQNYPIDRLPSAPDPHEYYPVLSTLERQNLAWDILAGTNVSQSYVSVPQFVAELKDIPSLIRTFGRSLIRNIASSNIAYRWAVKPLIHDLTAMSSFMLEVNRKLRELQLLRVNRKIKKRVMLSSGSYTTPPTTVYLNSSGAVIQAAMRTTYAQKTWGSATWKLSSDYELPSPANNELVYLARGIAMGWNLHGTLATSWELLPWSWFIDWFTGLGNVIAATNNTIPMTWSDLCIMRTSTAKRSFSPLPGTWSSWCKINKLPHEQGVRKERYLTAPILPFQPSLRRLLDPSAWSILASLWALKGNSRFTP